MTEEQILELRRPRTDGLHLIFTDILDALECARADGRQQRGRLQTLAEFARKIVQDYLFDGSDYAGVDIQDDAEAAGIIEPFTISQQDIDDARINTEYCNVGDISYRFADWMQTALQQGEGENG